MEVTFTDSNYFEEKNTQEVCAIQFEGPMFAPRFFYNVNSVAS